MRLCLVLGQQHSGRMFVRHWRIQRKRVLRDTGAIKELNKRGIEIVDACQFIYPEPPKQPEISPESRFEPRTIQPNESLVFNDSNVLLDGFNQAKVLTNTVESDPGKLPDSVNTRDVQLPDNIDDLVLKCIKSSLLYDTEQLKLPKRKDPLRPAWNFPRDYGITDKRRNKLLCLRLLDLCSKLSQPKPFIENGLFSLSLERQGLPVSFSLRSDALILSDKGIKPVPVEPSFHQLSLPDIAPLLSTVSIEIGLTPEEDHPLTSASKFNNIQLAISHFNETEVTNLFETPVTEDQFRGRSVMKAFTFAAAQARYLHGANVTDLPKPIMVPCLHTDSRRFHFSMFQLNTLRESGEKRNFLHSLPVMNIFSECKYLDAKPFVSDFNSDVFRTLYKFYNL